SRRVRPSMRPAAAGLLPAFSAAGLLYLASSLSEVLPEMLPLIAAAVYSGWLLVFLFKRITREYCIESDSITSRTFDWGRFSIESRHVPVDRIQGVETEKNGLYRHLLRIGNLVVKTSALDGVLILQDVNNPEDLRKELLKYQTRAVKRKKGREREELRRTLEGSGLGNMVPVKISSSELNQKTGKSGINGIRFRKSLAFLSGRLLLPVLVSLIPILGFDVLSELLHMPGRTILLLTLIPVLWALYRFEDWRNDSYQVTGGYVVDLYRKPLGLKESRRQVELASVQNIRTEQKGLIPFVFRFGNVILVTSGGAADTVFENVSRPWKVQEVLFRYREDELRRREVAMSEQRKDDFIRFSEALDQIRKPS
ncbi:MAG: PH domain-containing protein, partial [Spirochaetaceae bacterium]|nr:PH domain-containing protein [Spirochaetaceae bacterium]